MWIKKKEMKGGEGEEEQGGRKKNKDKFPSKLSNTGKLFYHKNKKNVISPTPSPPLSLSKRRKNQSLISLPLLPSVSLNPNTTIEITHASSNNENLQRIC